MNIKFDEFMEHKSCSFFKIYAFSKKKEFMILDLFVKAQPLKCAKPVSLVCNTFRPQVGRQEDGNLILTLKLNR